MKNEEKIPQHIVIVPDGNRRWAKAKGMSPWEGHLEGAKRMEEISQTALNLNIKCFSWWGGSLNNLTQRPKPEVHVLFKIYERYFRKLAKSKEIHQHEVKVNIIGQWIEVLPEKVKKAAQELIEATKNYNQYLLNLFIAYDGNNEMIEAVKKVAKKAREDKDLKITPQILKDNLWTHDLPEVDFLIRTGSSQDPHLSGGFMMWDCVNTQLYFPKELFPDFYKENFIKAVKDYQKRERRIGR